jgi:CheY-like chemotaxis protein
MAGRKILIVDDEASCVEFVKAILEEDGTQVVSAEDGDAGLKAAVAESPDLIILDVQMPKKDGFAVFMDLKKDEATKSIPVVMLTGIADKTGLRFSKEEMGEFMGDEPQVYVEKPVDPEALKAAVEKALGG